MVERRETIKWPLYTFTRHLHVGFEINIFICISPSPYDSIILNSSWHMTLQNQSKLISDFKLNSKACFPCCVPDSCLRLNWEKTTNRYFYCTKHSTIKKNLVQNIQILCNVFLNINSSNLDNNVTHLPLHYPLQKRRYR